MFGIEKRKLLNEFKLKSKSELFDLVNSQYLELGLEKFPANNIYILGISALLNMAVVNKKVLEMEVKKE